MEPQPSLTRKNEFHKPLVWISILNATMGFFLMGYFMSVINTLQNYLTYVVFQWDSATATSVTSWLNSSCTIGAGIGAFTGGKLAKTFGRRNSMIFTDILGIVAVILTLITNVPVMMIGRVLGGLAVGINTSLVPTYVQEITPLEVKGVAGSCIQLLCCTGNLVAYAFGFLLPTVSATNVVESSWWRFIMGFPLITLSLRCFILFVYSNFETPAYLVSERKEAEAKEVLHRLYTTEERVAEEFSNLKKARDGDKHHGIMKYSTLLTPKYRGRLFIGCFIALLQQLTGVNALVYYSTQIFNESGSGNAVMLTTLFGAFNLMATLFSGQVIRRFGRKTILIGGDIGISLWLVLIAIFGYLNKAVALNYFIMLYIITFGLSYGPVLWIFVAEILPDIGVGIAILINWIGAFVVAQGFQYYYAAVGIPAAFLSFGLVCLLSLIVIFWKVKETRDLTPHQISRLYHPNPAEDESNSDSEKNTPTRDKEETAGLIAAIDA